MVASPKIVGSKFSPVTTIGRSPQLSKKTAPKLSSFGKLDLAGGVNEEKAAKSNLLSKFGGHKQDGKIDTKFVDHTESLSTATVEIEIDQESESSVKAVGVNRKTRNVFKNIESLESHNVVKNKDVDLPILDCIKTTTVKKDKVDGDGFDSDEDERPNETKYEGYLIKISSNKTLLKRWFKLIHRDFYCIVFFDF